MTYKTEKLFELDGILTNLFTKDIYEYHDKARKFLLKVIDEVAEKKKDEIYPEDKIDANLEIGDIIHAYKYGVAMASRPIKFPFKTRLIDFDIFKNKILNYAYEFGAREEMERQRKLELKRPKSAERFKEEREEG